MKNDEVLNTVTHVVGAALALAGLVVLVVSASLKGDAWRITSFSIYGATLFLLYLSSSLYHGASGRLKKILRVVDHQSIYLLIAGTYTPFTLVSLRGPWGWSLFGVVWGLALVGIALRLLLNGRLHGLVVALYLAMGWVVVVAVQPMLDRVAPGGLALLAGGGLAYTGGVVFYKWKRLPYNHAIWHLFVLLGSALHFFAVLFYVIPWPPSAA